MNHLNSNVVSRLLAIGILLCVSMGSRAAEAAERYLRVPVFFITDRNLQKSKSGEVDFGPFRKYIGDCKDDPFMGSAYCVIENIEGKELSDKLKGLGWSACDPKDKLGDFKATPISADNFEKIQRDFYKQVREKATQSDDKNIFVFAHGYKNSFHGALGTAARFAYYAERPMIFYSWPSAARLRAYSVDEGNVEWSQEHFNDFVLRLAGMAKEDPSLKVRMFAHSMGTRLVVRATPFLREQSYLIEGGLICPDIDDGVVKHYAHRYLSENGSTEIRLYMSRHDKALPLSQYLHGGYTRLGEQADALASFVGKVFGADEPQEAAGDAAQQAVNDAEFSSRMAKTKARMQTIDFTAIDKGFFGHTVPAKLICNMSYTGTPGAGLDLSTEDSGRRSKMSNMFTRLAKLKDTEEKSDLSGKVFLVIKDAKVAGKHHKKSFSKSSRAPQPVSSH